MENLPRGSDNRNSQSSLSANRSDRNSASVDDGHAASVPEPNAARQSSSSIPPAVSVTTVGADCGHDTRSRTQVTEMQGRDLAANGESSARPLSMDGPPPPPYSSSPPPASATSDIDSARSSASYANNYASTEPTSPSLSVSISHEVHTSDQGDHGKAPTQLYLDTGNQGGVGQQGENSLSNPWLEELEQDTRSKSAEGVA